MSSPWYVQLAGTREDMAIALSLRGCSVWRIFETDGFACIELTGVPYDASPQLVMSLAEESFDVIRGVLRIYMPDSAVRLFIRTLFRREPDSAASQFVFVAGFRNNSALGASAAAYVGEHCPETTSQPVEWAVLASDPVVEKLLRLLGSGDHSFRQLYVAFEVIEEACGGMRKLCATGLVSDANVRRFKHTANSVAILGDSARHGKEKDTPPKNPMTEEEANAFIAGLAKSFISLRARRPTTS